MTDHWQERVRLERYDWNHGSACWAGDIKTLLDNIKKYQVDYCIVG